MIIYFISSPDDNNLVLTANPEIAETYRVVAKELGAQVEIKIWDTDTPICQIDLNIELIDDRPKIILP